ncbi:MAG TPA: hypothetical protein PKE06_21935 [Flavilitoribacter sp.]|nr:hypothetical protein [Flavilitoribacter sp.]HMQ86589.1 hypothetical protein [Flavilitoribacter sp.]
MQLNIWAILIFMSAVHGLLLALVLGRKKENRAANRIFAALLAAVALHLLEYTLTISGFLFKAPHLMFTTYLLLFVIGPLYYLYIRTLLGQPSGQGWKRPAHFLPALLFLLLMAPFYAQPANEKIRFFLTAAAYNFEQAPAAQFAVMYLQTAQIGLYLFFSLAVIRRKELSPAGSGSDENRIKLEGLKKATRLFFGFVIFYTVSLVFLLVSRSYRMEADYFVAVATAVLLYGVGYTALSYPRVLVEH